MKKFLTFLAALIGIVVVLVVILGVIEPKDVTVTRSVLIKAPKDSVFAQMANFRNWTHWSPWYKMDSGKMKMTYSGADGQAGSGYHWTGSDKTGEGEMKSTAINGTQMDFSVRFIEPHESEAHGMLSAKDTAGMTKATWSFAMHTPFPLNAMSVFMNFDKLLGGDFESGLNNMKVYLETPTGPVEVAKVDIREVTYAAHTFEGFRQETGWNDVLKYFMDSYVALDKQILSKKNGPAAGLFYTWDTVNRTTDMFAGYPVSDTQTKVKDGCVTRIAAAKAIMAVQTGGYSRSAEYHNAMEKYLKDRGKSYTLVIEEYVAGPHEEPDSNKWVTNIYYLVK